MPTEGTQVNGSGSETHQRHRFTGRRTDGQKPVVECNGRPLPNVVESLSDWFGWGHRGLSTQALAASMADHYNKTTFGLVSSQTAPLTSSDFMEALSRVKTSTFTIDVGGEEEQTRPHREPETKT